jgi:hypothetical protein
MELNELQNGDWVEVSGIPRQIKLIDDCINHKIIAHGVNKDGRTVAYVGKLNEDVKPIPLTLEILEKNGFTKHAYGFSFQYLKLDGNLRNDDTVYFTITISGKDITIDYVHQLQHALRLCGIKKEIEL